MQGTRARWLFRSRPGGEDGQFHSTHSANAMFHIGIDSSISSWTLKNEYRISKSSPLVKSQLVSCRSSCCRSRYRANFTWTLTGNTSRHSWSISILLTQWFAWPRLKISQKAWPTRLGQKHWAMDMKFQSATESFVKYTESQHFTPEAFSRQFDTSLSGRLRWGHLRLFPMREKIMSVSTMVIPVNGPKLHKARLETANRLGSWTAGWINFIMVRNGMRSPWSEIYHICAWVLYPTTRVRNLPCKEFSRVLSYMIFKSSVRDRWHLACHSEVLSISRLLGPVPYYYGSGNLNRCVTTFNYSSLSLLHK